MSFSIPFRTEFDFRYAQIETLSPLIRRVVARNPGPFTFYGTGTYIIGHGRVAVIDPGPDLAEHLDALRRGLRGETISHLLVTHTHRDHSPACAPLSLASGAPRYGYGPHGSGERRAQQRRDADTSANVDAVTVEEGGDSDFSPDVTLRDGDRIDGDGWTLQALYTPGHTSNHLCFYLPEERTLFSGDHVMGWSTSVISPPDGHMGDYLRSLQRLLERDDRYYWPTHGPRIDEPTKLVRAFIHHRRLRERQIVDCVDSGIDTIARMVPKLYAGVDKALYPAAARSLYASVLHLTEQRVLTAADEQTDTPAPHEQRLRRI